MQVGREFMLAELKLTRDFLDEWIQDIEEPTQVHPDGGTSKIYVDGVPVGLSISDLEGVPENQLRAELMAIAGKLEALATT